MAKRYTAVLKIVEVEDHEPAGQARRHTETAPVKTDSEILGVTLRSKSLEGLKTQLAAHVGLVPVEEQ